MRGPRSTACQLRRDGPLPLFIRAPTRLPGPMASPLRPWDAKRALRESGPMGPEARKRRGSLPADAEVARFRARPGAGLRQHSLGLHGLAPARQPQPLALLAGLAQDRRPAFRPPRLIPLCRALPQQRLQTVDPSLVRPSAPPNVAIEPKGNIATAKGECRGPAGRRRPSRGLPGGLLAAGGAPIDKARPPRGGQRHQQRQSDGTVAVPQHAP